MLPTATGNGIELARANPFAGVPFPVVSGAVPETWVVGAAALPPAVTSPGTSGLVPLGTPPHPARAHPARAAMAAPAKTALAEPCLLM